MRRRLLALALGAVALSGCTASEPDQPSATAFADGTCRAVAPDVLAIGRDVRRLGDGGEVDADVLRRLEEAQGRVRGLAETAEPSYKKALDDLVVAVGLVRLQGRVGTYAPEQGENLQRTYDSVVDACT